MKSASFFLSAVLLGSILCPPPAARAEIVVLEAFSVDEGKFTWHPTQSGSKRRVAATSTADRDPVTLSQKIVIDYARNDPAPDVPATLPAAWFLRHVAGGGSPDVNDPIPNKGSTWVGYWLKTTATSLEAGIMLDDDRNTNVSPAVNNHEISHFLPVINDGAWHLYQFELANTGDEIWQYFPFAYNDNAIGGAEAWGIINSDPVTIDSIVIRRMDDAEDLEEQVVFCVDCVAYNTAGPLPAKKLDELSISSATHNPATSRLDITFSSIPGLRYTVQTATALAASGQPGGWTQAAALNATADETTHSLDLATIGGGGAAPGTLFVRVTLEN